MMNCCLAGFLAPVYIGTTPAAFLLALPLIAVIAVAYKAIKVENLEFKAFVRESSILFGSIVAFMVLAAVVIYAVMKIIVG
jgi:hypothetical protein